MIRATIAATFAIAAFGGAASAAEPCPATPAIASLSTTVLDNRGARSPIERRRFGAEAAYLTIRYAPLDDMQAEALLLPLREAGVHEMDDLTLAWALSQLGLDGAQALLGADALDIVSTVGGMSAMRALVLGGNGKLVIDRLAALPSDKASTAFLTLVEAVIDLPDATKSALADLAMARGMPLLAGGLAAAQRDAAAWPKFVGVANDPAIVDAATRLWQWIPALVGNPALPRTPEQGPVADATASLRMHEVLRVVAMEPQADFLTSVLNQTGWVTEVAAAATQLRAAIEQGRVPEKGPLDAGWRIAYDALLANVLDAKTLTSVLGILGSDAPGYPGESVLTVLEMMAAVDALAPPINGKAAVALLPPHSDPSQTAIWETVISLAKALQTGTPPVDDATLPLVAQLLAAAGRTDELAALLAAQPPTGATLTLANDMALRLDRTCNAYLWHPGEALILDGASIFKFD